MNRNTSPSLVNNFVQAQNNLLQAFADIYEYWQSYNAGMTMYNTNFAIPAAKAMSYFMGVESERFFKTFPLETWNQYQKLSIFLLELMATERSSNIQSILQYHGQEMAQAFQAIWEPLKGNGSENILEFLSFKAQAAKAAAFEYPQAVKAIASEYGFHFERGGYEKVSETDRFYVYQVLPNEKGVKVRKGGKPILIVHPYVLGSDILAFLPGEKKSYVHCFANHGIPTYVRILKDIETNPAVQKITLEDDIRDTKEFARIITSRHKYPLTLNGYCQGGLITLVGLLSGELDGLVDAHITCVAPIDGSRSPGFVKFLHSLPPRFNNLAYGTKTLSNGNKVADGDLMSWVYKLKSISDEAPATALCRDMTMLEKIKRKGAEISKTAAALNYWLNHQRHDLPLEITKVSFASYNYPIDQEGNLPFQAFGRKLNIKSLEQKGVKWLICYGEHDSLVEKQTALAPLDYIQAETSAFPKGHVAIATSWSLPTSECALHSCFGRNNQRGPVRFQLDLENELIEKGSALQN